MKILFKHLIRSSHILLALGLILLPLASFAAYRPPKKISRPKPETLGGGGVRGPCASAATLKTPQAKANRAAIANAPQAIVAIAPHANVGQTASTHPTFAWSIPDRQSYKIEFELYDVSAGFAKGSLIYTAQLDSTPGLMKLTLPTTLAGLETSKRYAWHLTVVCNANRPAENRFVIREFEVVPPPSTLKPTVSKLELVNHYAEAGLWYDALSTAWTISDASQRQTIIRSLINDLANVETNSEVAKALQQLTAIQLRDR